MKIDNTTLAIFVGLAIAGLAAIVGLEWLGRDPEAVIYLLGAVAIPATVGIMTGRTTEATKRSVEEVRQEVNTVKTLVNGNTSRLLDRLEAHGEDVSEDRQRLRESGER